ncbi:LysM peptidoglycan-binding domain-containing protein [Rothia sp. CCM 9418]
MVLPNCLTELNGIATPDVIDVGQVIVIQLG